LTLQILECDLLFCGGTAEENGRLRQIYAKHWQTKLKLNKYRNIVRKLKLLDDDTLLPDKWRERTPIKRVKSNTHDTPSRNRCHKSTPFFCRRFSAPIFRITYVWNYKSFSVANDLRGVDRKSWSFQLFTFGNIYYCHIYRYLYSVKVVSLRSFTSGRPIIFYCDIAFTSVIFVFYLNGIINVSQLLAGNCAIFCVRSYFRYCYRFSSESSLHITLFSAGWSGTSPLGLNYWSWASKTEHLRLIAGVITFEETQPILNHGTSIMGLPSACMKQCPDLLTTWHFRETLVSRVVTAIHESIHHQFVIHPGRVQTSGPLTTMTFSVIELFFNLT